MNSQKDFSQKNFFKKVWCAWTAEADGNWLTLLTLGWPEWTLSHCKKSKNCQGFTKSNNWGQWKRNWASGRNPVKNYCLFHASHRQSGSIISFHNLWRNLWNAAILGQGGESSPPVTCGMHECLNLHRTRALGIKRRKWPLLGPQRPAWVILR